MNCAYFLFDLDRKHTIYGLYWSAVICATTFNNMYFIPSKLILILICGVFIAAAAVTNYCDDNDWFQVTVKCVSFFFFFFCCCCCCCVEWMGFVVFFFKFISFYLCDGCDRLIKKKLWPIIIWFAVIISLFFERRLPAMPSASIKCLLDFYWTVIQLIKN